MMWIMCGGWVICVFLFVVGICVQEVMFIVVECFIDVLIVNGIFDIEDSVILCLIVDVWRCVVCFDEFVDELVCCLGGGVCWIIMDECFFL